MRRAVGTALVLLALAGITGPGYRQNIRPLHLSLAASHQATEEQWAALQASLGDLQNTWQAAKTLVDWRKRWIRFQFYDGAKGFSSLEVLKSIRSAVARWPVPGGVSTAIEIAWCESGMNSRAKNSWSSASGIYQIVAGTWRSWWSAIVDARPAWQRAWRLKPSVFNARSNVIVAVIHAHRYGWGAWSCY